MSLACAWSFVLVRRHLVRLRKATPFVPMLLRGVPVHARRSRSCLLSRSRRPADAVDVGLHICRQLKIDDRTYS
eukprot:4685162-Pleurochrysis_carterae.AAC.1